MVRPDDLEKLSPVRKRVAAFVEHPKFIGFITILILINAVTLGLETDAGVMESHGAFLHLIDRSILVVFTLELLLKFFAYRFAFFKSGWNIFDLSIVLIAWIPSQGALSVLRTLRILRVLRLISVVPQMRRVVMALGYSLPGMGAVIGVLAIVFYVSAVLATKIFGVHPDPAMQEYFGSVAASAYTLFQIMTLEGWSDGIVRPTMKHFPNAWLFFLPFIIVTSFAVLNLFIGIIVDAMAFVAKEPGDDDQPQERVVVDILNRLERMEERQGEILKRLKAKK